MKTLLHVLSTMSIRNHHAFTTSMKMSLQLIHAVTTSTEMSMRPNHALVMTMRRHYQAQTVFTTIGLRPVYAHSRSLQTLGYYPGQPTSSVLTMHGGKTILRLVSCARIIRSPVLPNTHRAQKDEEEKYIIVKTHNDIYLFAITTGTDFSDLLLPFSTSSSTSFSFVLWRLT